MLGKIIAVDESMVLIKLDIDIYSTPVLIGKHVVFIDNNYTSIGEVISIENSIMKTILTGEIRNGKFLYGDITKPSFNANCQLIDNIHILDIYLHH